MSNIQAISVSRYSGKRWKRYTSYQFAAQESVVGLSMQELSKAMLHLPLAFFPMGEGFMLGAVLGLTPNKNLFVALDGRWVGGYIPAQYRGYPFLAVRSESGDRILCINEASGLVTENPDDEPFFTEEGTLAKTVADLLTFLGQVSGGQEAAQKGCEVLQKHGLIQPWPIKVQLETGEQEIKGLYRIDSQAMDQLPAEPLYELKQSGALSMAYCQLFSMQHLPTLGQLLQAHNRVQAQAAAPSSSELDLEFLNQSDTISFGGL